MRLWYSARGAAILTVGFAVGILLFSSIPAKSMPAPKSLWRWDKLIHAVEYAMLASLSMRVVFLRTRAAWSSALLAAVFACGFGVCDELYQSTTPGRDSSPFDMLADAAGACFACFVWAVVYSRRRPQHGHRSNF